ncbi:Cysteine synthase B [Carpediemonas membranifera]|uniref:Cysteine synthase B n=1 Tax=Carpediemonas membranifera TaxID=201153 RepID=A0A8J6EAX1_9EUKA|nr:Cysteine synthase B [Carpediemonas membranifera]|eukprot:KAG9395605.1 Cysteine synthase B [Carpediemonas membranifera]
MEYPTIIDTIGNTPLIRLQRKSYPNNNIVLLKLEAHNAGGSVKDRPVLNMLETALKEGTLKKTDKIVEPTSGNTGIALAMICAIKGLDLTLVMPKAMSIERRKLMGSYGATLLLSNSIESAITKAKDMVTNEGYKSLNQFANPANPEMHYKTTAQEIERQTKGAVTHVVSTMGTTGTACGIGRYMKDHDRDVQVIGVQPDESSSIQGSRNWPTEFIPAIFDRSLIEDVVDVSGAESLEAMRDLATSEGVLVGQSAGGAFLVAERIAHDPEVKNATIVAIMPDSGERYLSMPGWWEPNAKGCTEFE